MTNLEPPAPPERSFVSRWGYLFFLLFVLLGPVFDEDHDAFDWAVAIGVVLVCGGIYVRATVVGGKLVIPSAAAITAISVAVTPLGSSAISVVPIYAAALIATVGDRQTIVRRLAILTAVVVATLFLSPVPWPYIIFFGIPLIMIWFVGLSVHDDVSMAAATDELRLQNARIRHLATVTERERIARDLHDVAGQTLTALIMRSQMVEQFVRTDPDRAIEESRAIQGAARDLLAGFRESVSGWRLVAIDDELAGAADALRVSGVELVAEIEPVDLAPSVESVLALALREATTNVARHAHATVCRVELGPDGAGVRLSVSDDGRGVTGEPGNGLTGMRERVGAAGGTVDVSSRNGTTVTVSIPVGAG